MAMEKLIVTEKSYLTKLSLNEHETLLDLYVKDIDGQLNERPEIVVKGKTYRQNRNVAFFSDSSEGFSYSGQVAIPKPLTKSLKLLMALVNKVYGSNFNGILINEYKDGNNSIGIHSDDEKYLDPKGGVVAISYGATRTFRIKKKYDKFKKDFKARHLEAINMGGDFQKEFSHEIPKEKKIRDRRISFTFRNHSK